MKKYRLLAALLLLHCADGLHAEPVGIPGPAVRPPESAITLPKELGVFEAKTFTGTRCSLPYRILSPVEMKPGTLYPLVIFLHGAEQRGDGNIRQLSNGGALFADPKNRAAFPTFAVFPQCPEGKRWVEVNWGAPTSHQQPAEPSDPMSNVL